MIVNTVTSFTLHDIASGRHWLIVVAKNQTRQMGQHDV
jgi:hypothetical protein